MTKVHFSSNKSGDVANAAQLQMTPCPTQK